MELTRRSAPVRRPKLDGFTEIIDQWLREDLGQRAKQRHTAKRVFERLRDEHAFTGGYTIVKDYIREHRRRGREMFVPLHHPPGHAQADFGEATVVIGGVERTAHFFAFDLPHSDAGFVRAYPAATAEAWVDGHVHAFAFFGRVPQSVLYDNDRCLVARILPDGTRKRATLFSGFLSHYLIRDRYGSPLRARRDGEGGPSPSRRRSARACVRERHRSTSRSGPRSDPERSSVREWRISPGPWSARRSAGRTDPAGSLRRAGFRTRVALSSKSASASACLRACMSRIFSSTVPAADEPVDEDRLVLSDPVGAVHGLTLHRRVPPRIVVDHRVGLGQGQADAARLQAQQKHRRVALREGVEHLGAGSSSGR